MNQEDTTKALELIEQSSSFGLLLPEQPDFDILAAAEALGSVLMGDQKVVGLLSPAVLPADTDKTTFPRLTGPTPLLKEFIISVDTSHTPVAQLRYEKPENRIDIILTPKLAPLGQEAISFHEGTIRCNVLVAIGVSDVEHLSNMADFPPEFFTENKLINIDIGETNSRYGEANYVDPSQASRSELVYHLLASRPGFSLPPHMGTLLLAGILSATHELTSATTSADTFTAIAELIRLGGNHIEAQQLIRQRQQAQAQQPLMLLQLFARASVRSKHDEDQSILWSFLTTEDFTKTNRTPEDVPAVLEYVRVALPKSLVTVLIWQDPAAAASIHVLLSGDQAILDAIASKEDAEQISHGIRLRATFTSFRDAEESVHLLIRTAL